MSLDIELAVISNRDESKSLVIERNNDGEITRGAIILPWNVSVDQKSILGPIKVKQLEDWKVFLLSGDGVDRMMETTAKKFQILLKEVDQLQKQRKVTSTAYLLIHKHPEIFAQIQEGFNHQLPNITDPYNYTLAECFLNNVEAALEKYHTKAALLFP